MSGQSGDSIDREREHTVRIVPIWQPKVQSSTKVAISDVVSAVDFGELVL